jgi:hypothetical protein
MEAPKCSDRACEATDFLVGMFNGSLPDHGYPVILKSMSLEDVVDFISLLGRMACAAKGIAPGNGRPMTWAHADEVIGEGFEAAMGWPQSFGTILDSLSEGYSDSASNLKEVFGGFYAAMRRAPQESYGAAIRSVFVPYCYERFGISVDNYRPDSASEGHSSLEDARAILAVSPHAFGKIKKQLVLQRKGRQKFVDEREIRQICAARARVCNAKTMGQLLGLHVKKQLKEILDSGIFEVEEVSSDGRARMVDRPKVEALVARLHDPRQWRGHPVAEGELVNWAQLRRLASQREVSLPSLIELLIDGRLRPCGSFSNGLPGLSFERGATLSALENAIRSPRSRPVVSLGKVPPIACSALQ